MEVAGQPGLAIDSLDKYLQFVFITGVTKFAQMSMFPDLNHLDDLTLDPRYADICGWTQEEVEQNFGPEIEGEFRLYWYETGSSSFLIKLISKQKINIANLGNMRVGYNSFYRFGIEDINAVILLCQCGYLTISDYDEESDVFILDYPNLEVRSLISKLLIA